MKKLLKAVALATVMCMLLSTAAFAEEAKLPFDQTKDTVTVNVQTIANEQVVLLIVDWDAELATVGDDDIQFIDQVKAYSTGLAEFGEVAVKTADSKVDVYVGYAGTTPVKLGEDIDLKKVENITIVSGENAIIEASSESAEGVKGYAAAITVNIPEDLVVEKMIWGFKLSNGSRRFSKPVSYDGDAGALIAGATTYAAAFDVGEFKDAEGNVITDTAGNEVGITGVSAIFLTTDGREHFTDSTDAGYEKTQTNTENVEE